jgi:glutathione S-transferase
MDSVPIAKFIEENYPEPRLAPWDPASDELVLRMRSSIGPVLQASILPREPHILSPRSQEYFRRTRETQFGVALESLAEGDKEDKAWSAIDADLHTASDVLLAALAKGPFASGDLPGMRDFFVAGSMESARIVDKGVFGRIFAYRGFQDVYKACQPWMEKRD